MPDIDNTIISTSGKYEKNILHINDGIFVILNILK